jgi:hypothetical protein
MQPELLLFRPIYIAFFSAKTQSFNFFLFKPQTVFTAPSDNRTTAHSPNKKRPEMMDE